MTGLMPKKKLTIAIPTYNRASVLKQMLETLIVDLGDSVADVEILISNNCSTDETDEVISIWLNLNSEKVKVEYYNQSENIGVSKNIIFLLYHARTDYFMFLGDDDKINKTNISKVIQILKDKNPVALIQTVISGERYNPKKVAGEMTFSQAADYFYEYGNAWTGIIRTQDAILAIDSRNLRNEIEKIVWPQTVAGFLAINDSSDSAYGVDFEIGAQLVGSLNITNKHYWIRSFSDLLKAVEIVEKHTNANIHKKFMSARTAGFIAHVKAILVSSLISEDNASTKKLRHFMIRKFGFRGALWAMVLFISDFTLLMFLISIPAFALKGKWVGNSLRSIKEKRKQNILIQEKKVKRYGSWFE